MRKSVITILKTTVDKSEVIFPHSFSGCYEDELRLNGGWDVGEVCLGRGRDEAEMRLK